MELVLPESVQKILGRLNEAGYEAYVVGGCVRDTLLGLPPKDWDICTSAEPDQMQQAFRGWHVVETGLKHGTLTVVLEHVPYEVTTFRTDGTYTDHRHPDSVRFVTDVTEDLARRDFTVNAMAYHPDRGLVDAFGGQRDLTAMRLRCVGRAEERFGEDALRVLRALRFASCYDMDIEQETDAAIRSRYPDLKDVAGERIRVELEKLLCGRAAGRILRSYTEVFTWLIPELKACVGFDQRSPHHRFDVWEHTVRSVCSIEPDPVLRLTMLMHDSGKPAAFFVGEDGIGHAWGHPEISAKYADALLDRLHMDNASHETILTLVRNHDIEMNTGLLRRRLSQLGQENLRKLIRVQRADNLSKGTQDPDGVENRAAQLTFALDELVAGSSCVTLKQLAVNGGDLMAAGLPKGPDVGRCLQFLLDAVIDDRIPNEKEALLAAAAGWREDQNVKS